MPYRIVVPHDYGPEADLALEWAANLVKSAGGTLVLLHVILNPAPPVKRMPMIPALRPTEDPDESTRRLVGIIRGPASGTGVSETPGQYDCGTYKLAQTLDADTIAWIQQSASQGKCAP